ncbi:MAG: type II secretion system F family protein [Proteobacteria bacterium]|nr:type II secretion system F family protein [Pseudomonadota bacterium]
MPEFQYKAKDSSGRTRSGKVTAHSKAQARALITRMRLNVLQITTTKLDSSGGKDNGDDGVTPILGNVIVKDKDGKIQLQLGSSAPSVKDIIVFTKQFATMIGSGVPLVQAIGVLAEQQLVPSFGRTLNRIRFSVENGATLSESLEAYPKIFESLYVSLVRAGEASGNLDTILLTLTVYLEKAAKIKSQVKSAMFYPLMVVAVAVIVITVLLVFVVPIFAKQYSDSGKELPFMTAMVVNASTFLTTHAIPIAIGVVGTLLGIRAYLKTSQGRAILDDGLLRLPGFGILFRKLAVGRFCNTMSTMLTAGLNILEALTICAASSGNKTIEKFVLGVRGKIEQGAKFSETLAEGGLIPSMVISMVAVGETTGALDDMLVKVSQFYEDEVDVAVKTLLSMIEPFMIVVIGGIVGFIVIAMYLPIFDMASLGPG